MLLGTAVSRVRVKFCHFRSISTSAAQFNEDQRKKLPSRKYYEDLTENVYMEKKIARRSRRAFEAMVESPIVVKKFFISDVKEDDFKFPDVLTKNDLDVSAQLTDYFTHRIEHTESGFAPSVYETFRNEKLFGNNIPTEYGGRGFSYTRCTFASEIEALNIDAALALNHHRLVCTAITEFGSEEQCAKYLPKLANGDTIGTTAFKEWNDATKIGWNTQAEYDDDNEEWCLNGTKSFVVNAADSNLLLVTAQTQTNDRKGDKKNSLTMFLVDSTLPGIEILRKNDTIGCTNLYQATIKFDNVILSKDSILMIPGSGDYIQRKIEIYSRINQGLLHLTQMKQTLQYMLNMVESTEHETRAENENTEFQALRMTIGKHATFIYALESMLYLTTGIMDKHNNTNIDLETAIFKVYSQKLLMDMTMDLLNFVDTRVTLDDHQLNQFIRNSVQLNFDEFSNDLKQHIGTEGIQYRMKRMIEEVTIKNNKEFVVKSFMDERNLELYEPEVRKAAKTLFDSIILLRLGASRILNSEARDLPKQHIEMEKIADASACIYASFACLLRAERSLQLKLPNAADEAFIADTICDLNAAEVRLLMDYIEDGPMKTFSKYHELMTQVLLEKGSKSNFPVHPLTSLF